MMIDIHGIVLADNAQQAEMNLLALAMGSMST